MKSSFTVFYLTLIFLVFSSCVKISGIEPIKINTVKPTTGNSIFKVITNNEILSYVFNYGGTIDCGWEKSYTSKIQYVQYSGFVQVGGFELKNRIVVNTYSASTPETPINDNEFLLEFGFIINGNTIDLKATSGELKITSIRKSVLSEFNGISESDSCLVVSGSWVGNLNNQFKGEFKMNNVPFVYK
jgi:hypothetical protein